MYSKYILCFLEFQEEILRLNFMMLGDCLVFEIGIYNFFGKSHNRT